MGACTDHFSAKMNNIRRLVALLQRQDHNFYNLKKLAYFTFFLTFDAYISAVKKKIKFYNLRLVSSNSWRQTRLYSFTGPIQSVLGARARRSTGGIHRRSSCDRGPHFKSTFC
jgi:hypothetical protein